MFFQLFWCVVNCFHFSVSLGYKTTTAKPCANALLLWIAFIFQYLWDTKQQKIGSDTLLSQLWIAFIFQYLWDTKQHSVVDIEKSISCELLSFFSIFGIQNNISGVINIFELVVNCFHFSVSLGYKTTQANRNRF